MQLRGYHLGAAAALETRENADAAAAGVADRHDVVFNRDAAFALALLEAGMAGRLDRQSAHVVLWFDPSLRG